jgi:hypothetical protein
MPQTVTTAEVIPETDTWNQLSLESITEQTKNSWTIYGCAILVIHPRQFFGPDSEARWNTYYQVLDWIQSNQGRIVHPEPPRPETPHQYDSLLLSMGIFVGLTSTLLIAFNMSSKKSIENSSRTHTKRRKPTVAVLLLSAIACGAAVSLWSTSAKSYLDLGLPWLGLSYGGVTLGVGLFEGKIFYSSIITFAIAFALAYVFLANGQHVHPITSIVVSGLVVLSGAYLFEYVYLFLNHRVLYKYLGRAHWWVNLLSGFVVGFGFRFMRITKWSVMTFGLFVLTMGVWFLGGYPQLADKETPVFLFKNYLNLPVETAFPLNALSKFFACISVVSLLSKRTIRRQAIAQDWMVMEKTSQEQKDGSVIRTQLQSGRLDDIP